MQTYIDSNRLSLKTIALFIAVAFVAFLPVTSFQFFLKNDAFTGYFPPKFFMSESIHAGHLPLWNPYINFGIPQYGDMSSGYWSPVTWLVASVFGYTAYTFTTELFLYILLGGLGMYKLLGYWKIRNEVKFICGAAFICSGYNIGHLQHFNWLSGACFLPWCIWAYLLLFDKFSVKSCVRAALLFYFLISSAHPGISIGAFYFFVFLLIYKIFFEAGKKNIGQNIKRTLSAHFLTVIITLLLSAGMIAGYLDVLPNFSRGEELAITETLQNPTGPASWMSVMVPFSTVKNSALFNTDISMRNCYFSAVLLLFLISSLFQKKSRQQYFFLFTGVFFALLSSGGIFKIIAHNILPGIGYVRLNGEFRIFAMMSFMIVAAMEFSRYISAGLNLTRFLKYLFLAFQIVCIGLVVYGFTNIIVQHDSFLFAGKLITGQPGATAKLKQLLDSVSFYDTLWIQGFIQLIVFTGLKFCIKNNRMMLLKAFVILDLVAASLLNIPFTGVGKASVKNVQTILNRSPRGIPVPIMQPAILHDSLSGQSPDLQAIGAFTTNR